MINDVGIIYTPQPFLLAVYTKFVGETIVAEAAKLFTAYNLSKEPLEAPTTIELEVEFIPEEVEEVQAVIAQQESAEEPQVVLPTEEEPEHAQMFTWWMPVVAIGVFLVGGGIVLTALSPKRMKKMEEKYKK